VENKPTYEELERENGELKDILAKVIKAYDILDKVLKQYKEKNAGSMNSTVTSVNDVKKLLDKYSHF
jgi:hypothetical protein